MLYAHCVVYLITVQSISQNKPKALTIKCSVPSAIQLGAQGVINSMSNNLSFSSFLYIPSSQMLTGAGADNKLEKN